MAFGLPLGTRITTKFNKELRVVRQLGYGAHSIVYEVLYDGRPMALKWYKPNASIDRQRFIDGLRSNILHGRPTEEFMWPQDMTDEIDGSFGYVTDLRPEGFVEADELLIKPGMFPSCRRAIDACLGIVSAFRALHNRGYCFLDASGNNFLVNPARGKVLVCGSDNIALAGTNAGICGTPRFMAPEAVVGNNVLSIQSDRHSMSVLIFYLLLAHHPLEGARLTKCGVLDGTTPKRIYGSNPVFIMDPDDYTNRPDPSYPNALMMWPLLPKHMQDIFLRAFSKTALANPNRRPSELEWILELTRFRSEVVTCSCGNEVFMQDAKPISCDNPECRREVSVPLRAELSGYSVPFVDDTRFYRCQTCTCNPNVALDPLAWVTCAVGHADVLGIKNISSDPWTVSQGGSKRVVLPGRTVRAIPDMTVDLYDERIRIRRNEQGPDARPSMDGTETVMRPNLHVFYVLDTCGGMKNRPIGVLNRAMEVTVDTLKQVTAQNSDVNVKIAVLEFNSTCHWINPVGPECLEDFFWQELFAAGKRDVGAALRELDSKLSRNAFLDPMASTFPPVIIFVTNGFATDDYEKELERILRNKWFAKATRAGFAIGRNPDTEMMAKLVGSSEAVIRTDDLSLFARLLQDVSVAASTLAGNSHTHDSKVSGKEAVKMGLAKSGISEEEVSAGFAYEETPVVDFDTNS